jgi:hypothetical protein
MGQVLTLQGDENEVIETLTEQDRRRIARERELESDLAAAADLMGSTGVEDGKLSRPSSSWHN